MHQAASTANDGEPLFFYEFTDYYLVALLRLSFFAVGLIPAIYSFKKVETMEKKEASKKEIPKSWAYVGKPPDERK
jgi:hypothetical protein